MFRRRNWRGLTEVLRETSRPGTFTDADLEHYRGAWSEPGAMTAMINWYRAPMRNRPAPPPDPRVHIPTLMIWGAKDRFLDQGLARPSLEYCDHGRLEMIEEASHWVQHEEPGRVNRFLLNFLGAEVSPAGL
jgi:epoxide hydrolase 4